ncbi:hypothetical protein F4802DRAFT_598830 [Xylaria palmicola]|nr:hypothetical protein F4802DRAFT_598830 [Xylaria palmicola]
MATPSKNKTNFKTFEASTRLLAAVIATTNVKLDYDELARHMGGGTTKDAVNHRLRPIKQLAKMQATCVKQGEDPGELPVDKGALATLVGGGATSSALEHRMRPIKQLAKLQLAYRDNDKDPGELPIEKNEIQKLFGESTPGGIEWRFRDIKSLGKAQKQAVQEGRNPATVLTTDTPSSARKRSAAASTPGSRAATPGSRRRRTAPVAALPPVDSSDSDGGNDSDCNIVETPTKRPAKKAKVAAAAAANGNGVAARVETGVPARSLSIFGDGTNIPAAVQPAATFLDGNQAIAAQQAAAKPPVIKEEVVNQFLSAANYGSFDAGSSYYEDGEV